MSQHALLGPSAAESWWHCADYPNVVREHGQQSSEAAALGTVAHAVSDLCLSLGLEPHDFIGRRFREDRWTFEVDEEMADYLLPGIDRIRELPGRFYGEQKVDISRWTLPGQFGTLDRAVVGRREIVIGDLKYGWEPVHVVENKQLMLYALGFWHTIARHQSDAVRFRLIVDQPRNPKGGGEWVTTLDDLLEFGKEAKKRALATQVRNPTRTASEKGCRFCPAKDPANGGCRAYDDMMLEIIQKKFDDFESDVDLDIPPRLPRYEGLTAEQRVYIWKHATLFRKWLDDIANALLSSAINGDPVPGTKAVEGRRAAAKYRDPAEAEDFLVDLLGEERAFTKKLISPAQAKKMVKGDDVRRFWRLVDRGEAKPILVDERDARPAISSIADKFDDESDDE